MADQFHYEVADQLSLNEFRSLLFEFVALSRILWLESEYKLTVQAVLVFLAFALTELVQALYFLFQKILFAEQLFQAKF